MKNSCSGGTWRWAAGLLLATVSVIARPVPPHKLLPHADHAHLRCLRGMPNDPLFPSQWHLQNTAQGGGTAGMDLNVVPWWDFENGRHLGAGVVIGIIESGVEVTHPDLAANYRPALSWDFLSGDSDPSPLGGNGHGTAVAGIALASGHNHLGVCGVAPQAGLAALRLVSPTFQTDALEAAALTYQHDNENGIGTIHIYENAWGLQDDGRTLGGPGPLLRDALAHGAQTGRSGLGSLYVWAAGNGKGQLDHAGYDGYVSSRYVIAVGACSNEGHATTYSEPGSCLFVCAPADGGPGGNSQITTTDRSGVLGYNTSPATGDYVTTFAGTSAAAPQVAGVIALMLEANPALTWRDVKHLLARTARRIEPDNPGWNSNAAGFHHHHDFGFGLVDATAACVLAETWTNVPPEISATSGLLRVDQPVADGSGINLTAPIFGPATTATFICTSSMKVETVSITVNVTHPYRGDLQFELTSPTGITSLLGTPRNDSGDNYTAWTFTTVRHWGEYPAGLWTLRLRDAYINDSAQWHDWTITFHGTPLSRPPEITTLTVAPGTLNLTFATEPAARYQIFSTTNLASAAWSPLGSPVSAVADFHQTTVPFNPSESARFYRAAVVH